jgi:hypothetical protein
MRLLLAPFNNHSIKTFANINETFLSNGISGELNLLANFCQDKINIPLTLLKILEAQKNPWTLHSTLSAERSGIDWLYSNLKHISTLQRHLFNEVTGINLRMEMYLRTILGTCLDGNSSDKTR